MLCFRRTTERTVHSSYIISHGKAQCNDALFARVREENCTIALVKKKKMKEREDNFCKVLRIKNCTLDSYLFY